MLSSSTISTKKIPIPLYSVFFKRIIFLEVIMVFCRDLNFYFILYFIFSYAKMFIVAFIEIWQPLFICSLFECLQR